MASHSQNTLVFAPISLLYGASGARYPIKPVLLAPEAPEVLVKYTEKNTKNDPHNRYIHCIEGLRMGC